MGWLIYFTYQGAIVGWDVAGIILTGAGVGGGIGVDCGLVKIGWHE